jgi:hypothetical protein
MIRLKGLYPVILFLLMSTLVLGAQEKRGTDVDSVEMELPVRVSINNGSSHPVEVQILSFDTISETHPMAPGSHLELEVKYGHVVRLEYAPCPRRTTFSQIGSLNELNRTIHLRDDGDYIFVQEKFSGSRKQGRGNLRSPREIISEPEAECVGQAQKKSDAENPKNTPDVRKSGQGTDPLLINRGGTSTKRKSSKSAAAVKSAKAKAKSKDKKKEKEKIY